MQTGDNASGRRCTKTPQGGVSGSVELQTNCNLYTLKASSNRLKSQYELCNFEFVHLLKNVDYLVLSEFGLSVMAVFNNLHPKVIGFPRLGIAHATVAKMV